MSASLDIPTLREQFHRDGFLVLPNALTPEQVTRLRAGAEEAFSREDPAAAPYGNLQKIWRPTMFRRGPDFEALIDHSPVIDLIEAILGSDCHMVAMNALRTGPGEGISGWHADETIRFPRPEDVPLDPRIPMPCFMANVNYYLCDVDEELGPTQWVPGSHRAGRNPKPTDMDANGTPVFEGQSMVSGVGTAGTAVVWHDQVWHRGAPNRTPDRVRWVSGVAYGRRFIAQRFYPFVNYPMPQEILERANPRRKRLLGVHGPGAYG